VTTTNSLFATIIYGAIFTFVQAYEYNVAPFSINDGIFGSLFFLLTGFHGFHGLVMTILIIGLR
jgi:cytochrome c oxidase subunit 3